MKKIVIGALLILILITSGVVMYFYFGNRTDNIDGSQDQVQLEESVINEAVPPPPDPESEYPKFEAVGDPYAQPVGTD